MRMNAIAWRFVSENLPVRYPFVICPVLLKSPPTAYCFSQLKQGTYSLQLNYHIIKSPLPQEMINTGSLIKIFLSRKTFIRQCEQKSIAHKNSLRASALRRYPETACKYKLLFFCLVSIMTICKCHKTNSIRINIS